MDTRDFLNTVITCPLPEGGYFCLATGAGGSWMESWYKWPNDIETIVAHAERVKDHGNVYFSSYLFKAPQSTKENVLPSRTIQADLDDADVKTLPREPTVLVETSPGRHQGYWVLNGPALPLDEHEVLSKKLTYSIVLCDKSGWPLGRKVRLPNTLNHKYLSGPKAVTVVRADGSTVEPGDLESLPEVPTFVVEHYSDDFIENPGGAGGAGSPHDIIGEEILDSIRDAVPPLVWVQYHSRQEDRSAALWSLMQHGFKAGLSREQVFVLARDSANNKFLDLRQRADQALAKDVLRAEHAIKSGVQDDRAVVLDILKGPLAPLDKHRALATVVIKSLKGLGEFLRVKQGTAWYIRKDLGHPVEVSPRSHELQTLLDIQFGLNPVEQSARYVIHAIDGYAYSLPTEANYGALSLYDVSAKPPHVLIHTGTKNVVRVTASQIETVTNGAYGTVFPWPDSAEKFTPALAGASADWGQELFGDSVNNITNMTPPQALALLKVWLLFVLMRNAAHSRPILAALGAPGSGKSVLFKKIYALLYGPYKSVEVVKERENYDISMAYDPLLVIDNVDTWQDWLPDQIATAAGVSDVSARKKYTDGERYVLRRQAMLAITAHNPKFGREDVVDRFLMLSYQRLETFGDESKIIKRVLARRGELWGGVLKDIQRVLASPPVTDQDDVPQFRIQDFARLGLWIARALGCEADFRASIEDVKTAATGFTLENEGLLVNALLKHAQKQSLNGHSSEYYTSTQLWTRLEAACDETRAFVSRYRNPIALARKLSSMKAPLSQIITIESSEQPGTKSKTWRILPAGFTPPKEQQNG